MNSEDLETLRELNRNYIRSAAQSDVRWYDDNLAQDYMATNPDGSFVDTLASRVHRMNPSLQFADTAQRVP